MLLRRILHCIPSITRHLESVTGFAASSDAEMAKPRGRFSKALARRLWGIIRPHQRYIWVSLALLLASAGCRLTLPFLVMTAIDLYLLEGQLDGYWWLVWGYIGIAGVESLLRRWQMVSLERAAQASLLSLRMKVFSHLQRLPAAFFDRTPIGRLVGRVTTDVEALQEMFSSGLVTILGDLVFLIAAFCILVGLSLKLTLMTMLMVPVLVGVTLFVRVRVRHAYSAMRAKLSTLNGFIHEQVSGMSIIQMFGQETRAADAFRDVNGGVRNAQLQSVRLESILSASTEMLGSFTTALILWFGGGLALLAMGAQPDDVVAGLTLGTLFAFVDYMQKFFVPLNDLSLKYTVMQNAMIASERIFGLLDEVPESAEPSEPVTTNGAGGIEFRGVNFHYDPRQPVIKDLSFVVKPGERIAVVGATGAGKSTILSLLTRLYEVEGGQILLDGIDTRLLMREDLRRQIGVVPQDVFLFRGTILDNIRLGQPDISDAEAIAAADVLHLDEVVSRFPGGYYEPIAERGKNLSAGEKQLIAFARMLVIAPKVLALDEATSNVDSHTEHLLQDAVHRLMAGRTAIIIAHRMSTIRDVDRILVMAKGRLVEHGSHAELMQKAGVYRELYELQYKNQEDA